MIRRGIASVAGLGGESGGASAADRGDDGNAPSEAAPWGLLRRLGFGIESPPASPPVSPPGSPSILTSRHGNEKLVPRFASWARGRVSYNRGATLILGALALGTALQVASLIGGAIVGSGVSSREARWRAQRRRRVSGGGASLPSEAFAPPPVAQGGDDSEQSFDSTVGGEEELPGLTTADTAYMANVMGFANFTSFVRMPKQHSFGQSADGSAIPCLWSEALQRNVYLIPGGWDQTSSRSSPQDRHACPDPAGGQLPPPSQRPRTSNSFFGGAAAGDGEVPLAGAVDDLAGDDDDFEATPVGGWRPEVTFVVSVLRREGMHPRLAASVALETAIAVFRHADEVPASEFIFVDHTALSLNPNAQSAGSSSSGGDSGGDGSGGIGGSVHELDRSGLRPDGSLDLSELEQFLKFLEGAFDLHIRFLRVASGNSGGKGGSSEGGSSYLDVLRAAAELASGRLLCLVEAGNILQPGGLAALVGTVAAYPEAAMVVPMLLRQDGKVHEAGGVILSDGTLVRFGHGMDSDDPSVCFARDADYGSWSVAVVRRRLFKGLGLPDARFRPGFFADADASLALKASGWRVLFQPFAHAIHYESAGSTSGGGAAGVGSGGAGGWAAWVPAHLEGSAAAVVERLANHGVPSDAAAASGDWPLGRRRSIALNQHKLASKWAQTLSCHWAPASLPLSPLLGHNAPLSTDAAGREGLSWEAEAAEAARATAKRRRFAQAGGVLKAFDEAIGVATPGGGGGGGAAQPRKPLTPQQAASVAAAAEAKQKEAAEAAARGAAARGLDFLSSRGATLRVLFVDWIAPEVDRDSGSIRARYMLQILLSMRCAVSFIAVDAQRPLRYRDELRFMGVKVLALRQLRAALAAPSLAAASPLRASVAAGLPGAPFAGATGAAVAALNGSEGSGDDAAEWPCPFDVIFLSRRDAFRAAYPILTQHPASCAGVPIIFDTVDLHFLREAREAEYRSKYATGGSDGVMLEAIFGRDNGKAKTGLRERQESTRAVREAAADVELQFVAFSSATLVVSPFEAGEVAARVPRAAIRVVSNIHVLEPTPLGFWQRSGAVFTGNFNHLPNRDAILFFAQAVLPLVHPKVGPDFVFHVIGANHCPEAIARLNGTTIDGVVRIIVHGYVEDLKAFYGKMRVSVVPLRWGAGVKGKVNSAMSHGVPVVCSTVAQEGMHLVDGKDALIADDPALFAQKVLEAYTSERVWRRLRAGGFSNIRTYFSISQAVHGMVDTLDVALNGKAVANRRSSSSSNSGAGGSGLDAYSNPLAHGDDGQADGSAAARARLAFGGCALDPRCACSPQGLRGSLKQALPRPHPPFLDAEPG